MIRMKRVLFICNHNSTRSQMAEGYTLSGGGVYLHSTEFNPPALGKTGF
jgi:predicted protein tyrosine phosphatase